MTDNLLKYGRYKCDIFRKLAFDFCPGRDILDVGCGNGKDAAIFINEFKLNCCASDIYKHESIDRIIGLHYEKGSIFSLPWPDSRFDYVFLHDVLHHIDEKEQSQENHLRGLRELRRVTKDNGYIILIEANRYNPIFFPHMVIWKKHEHFRQDYFRKIIGTAFSGDEVVFKYFEAHSYPKLLVPIFKIYEFLAEKFFPKSLLAYNVAIIKIKK